MNRLKEWYLLQGKSIAYFAIAFLVAIISFYSSSLRWLPSAIKLLLGLVGFGLAIHFFFLSYKIANSFMREGLHERVNSVSSRVIDIRSGAYNESVNVHGDQIQGDKHVNNFTSFNFSQNASNAIDEIREILDKLTEQYGNREYAQQKAIDDLVFIIRQNKSAKGKLNLWLGTLNSQGTDDEIEAAQKVIELVDSKRKPPFWKSLIESEQSKKKYQKLIFLLKNSQWREADEETVVLVKKLMPSPQRSYGCSNISVSQISPRELRAINKIWLEASGGRFGFSIQKRIWQRIHKFDLNSQSDIGKSEYDMFAEAVGWSNDMSRIYHVDFDYKITNPKGHLPAKILLLETYNPNSKYCSLSACLFDEFMKREYSDVSFLPDWLRKWLLLD